MVRALLDVNVLIAYGVQSHTHHAAVSRWFLEHTDSLEAFTCPIVELGFVRISMVLSSIKLHETQMLLQEIKEKLKATMIPDTLGADALPSWVQGHKQTTDGYLLALAEAHGLKLLTLDKKLPNAVAI